MSFLFYYFNFWPKAMKKRIKKNIVLCLYRHLTNPNEPGYRHRSKKAPNMQFSSQNGLLLPNWLLIEIFSSLLIEMDPLFIRTVSVALLDWQQNILRWYIYYLDQGRHLNVSQKIIVQSVEFHSLFAHTQNYHPSCEIRKYIIYCYNWDQ